MTKHSEATLAKIRKLYLQRKAMRTGKKFVEVDTPAKFPTVKEQADYRASQIAHLKEILASPLPETESELRAEEVSLVLNNALECEVKADNMATYLQIRARYMMVVDRLTDMLIPDNGSCLENHGIKRLALEVISAACNDARLPSKDSAGRKIRSDAILFLNGRSASQVQTRNAWLRAAGIEIDYYDRKFDSDTLKRRRLT